MPPFLVAGLAAGIATAVLFASASAGGMAGRVILFFLAPLPCYLAGLGWGSAAAAIAATASAIGTGATLGLRTGAVFFLSQGIPLAVLCHLALLNRPASAAAAPGAQPAVEWYPVGRVVAAATLLAGSLAFLSLIMLGNDLEQLRAIMRELVEKVLLKQIPSLGGGKLGEPEINALAEMLLYALPAGSALLWLGGFVLNLWLAGRITLLSGRLSRPWPDLAQMRFPRGFGLGLALSLLLMLLLSGFAGLLASGFAGAFLFAYLLMGLAVIHYATRGLAARPFVLWGVYVALLVLNTWAALAIAMIAVLEPMLPWRRPPST